MTGRSKMRIRWRARAGEGCARQRGCAILGGGLLVPSYISILKSAKELVRLVYVFPSLNVREPQLTNATVQAESDVVADSLFFD